MSTQAKIASLLPLALIIIVAGALPYVASAAVSGNVNNNVWNPSILKGPLVVCTGDGSSGVPCQSFCDLIAQIAHVVYYFIAVAIWAIAPIMIAISGISLITSNGNAEAMKGAKNRATRVAMGILIVLCAYLIISVFTHVLGIGGVGGFTGALCSS